MTSLNLRSVPDSATNGEVEPAGSLLSLVNVVLSQRVLIFGLAALAGFTVAVYQLSQPRTYTTQMSFMPQARSTQTPGGATGIAAQLGLSLPGTTGGNSPLFYVDLIKSRKILGALVEREYRFPYESGTFSGPLLELYGAGEETPALQRDEAIENLGKGIGAEANLRTGVVLVRVSSIDPVLTQQIATELLAQIDQFNLITRRSQASAERTFSEKRLEEAAAELRTAEDQLESFLEQNRDVSGSPRLSFAQDRLTRVMSMRRELYTSLALAVEQSKAEEVRDTPVMTVVEDPELPLRPDRRGIVRNFLLAIMGGALVAMVIVFIRTYLARARVESTDDFTEFTQLRGEALGDLLHPWRLIRRSGSREA